MIKKDATKKSIDTFKCCSEDDFFYVDSNKVLKENQISENSSVNTKGKWCLLKLIFDHRINKISSYSQTRMEEHYFQPNKGNEFATSNRYTLETKTKKKLSAQTQT